MAHRRSGRVILQFARGMRREMTDAERMLWRVLRSHQLHDVHFRRQHPIGRYIVDFCAPRWKLVVEVDGGQHAQQAVYDAERSAFLEAEGYRVCRFWNHEVLEDVDAVARKILEVIEGG